MSKDEVDGIHPNGMKSQSVIFNRAFDHHGDSLRVRPIFYDILDDLDGIVDSEGNLLTGEDFEDIEKYVATTQSSFNFDISDIPDYSLFYFIDVGSLFYLDPGEDEFLKVGHMAPGRPIMVLNKEETDQTFDVEDDDYTVAFDLHHTGRMPESYNVEFYINGERIPDEDVSSPLVLSMETTNTASYDGEETELHIFDIDVDFDDDFINPKDKKQYIGIKLLSEFGDIVVDTLSFWVKAPEEKEEWEF